MLIFIGFIRFSSIRVQSVWYALENKQTPGIAGFLLLYIPYLSSTTSRFFQIEFIFIIVIFIVFVKNIL